MDVLRCLRSNSSERLKSALTLYYELTEEIASQVVQFVRDQFFCNGCFIEHGSQLQHDCFKSEVEKLDHLFFTAITNVKEDIVIDEWFNRLKAKDIHRDILYIPFQWRRDSNFLDDIRSCALDHYGTEAN